MVRERHNPPQTSEQAACLGCIRQIQIVQKYKDQRYLDRMSEMINSIGMSDAIKKLKREVQMERFLRQQQPTAEREENNEEIQRLEKMNEELVKMLREELEIPQQFPLTEWKNDIEFTWKEMYTALKERKYHYKEKSKQLEETVKQQQQEIEKLQKALAQQMKM